MRAGASRLALWRFAWTWGGRPTRASARGPGSSTEEVENAQDKVAWPLCIGFREECGRSSLGKKGRGQWIQQEALASRRRICEDHAVIETLFGKNGRREPSCEPAADPFERPRPRRGVHPGGHLEPSAGHA